MTKGRPPIPFARDPDRFAMALYHMGRRAGLSEGRARKQAVAMVLGDFNSEDHPADKAILGKRKREHLDRQLRGKIKGHKGFAKKRQRASGVRQMQTVKAIVRSLPENRWPEIMGDLLFTLFRGDDLALRALAFSHLGLAGFHFPNSEPLAEIQAYADSHFDRDKIGPFYGCGRAALPTAAFKKQIERRRDKYWKQFAGKART